MKSAIKIAGLTIAVILVLSITVNKKTFFEYIYSAISPATKAVQQATEDVASYSFKETQKFTKKLFDNSVPRFKDSIKSQASAPVRVSGEPEEAIETEDKAQLDELIKSHQK